MLREAPDPIELAKAFGVPQSEVAVRLGVTRDWARHLAHDPRHVHRVRVAALEAILDAERRRDLAMALAG